MSYFNFPRPRQIDEARYQTIGRGHGFLELEGVPFKIAEKYQHIKTNYQDPSENAYQLSSTQAVDVASAYTFQLEKKVLDNMRHRRC